MSRARVTLTSTLVCCIGMLVAAATSALAVRAGAERFLVDGGGGARKAHVLLRQGLQARLLVAFPAGNFAAALWFARPGAKSPPDLTLRDAALIDEGPGLHKRWGASVTLVAPPEPLILVRSLCHNIRTVRGYVEGYPRAAAAQVERLIALLPRLPTEVLGRLARLDVTVSTLHQWLDTLPRSIANRNPDGAGAELVHARTTLGGKGDVEVRIAVRGGKARRTSDGIRITPVGGAPLRIVVTTLHPYAPPMPIPPDELLSPRGKAVWDRLATRDPVRWREVSDALAGISFLASRETFLAGSFRFLTYFGRDTLIFLMLMGPYLSDAAWSAGLGAILDRLGPAGMPAHEEAVEEEGVLQHLERFADLWPIRRAGALAQVSDLEAGRFSVLDDTMVDTLPMVPLALAAMARHHFQAARRLVEDHSAATLRCLRAVLRAARGPAQMRRIGQAFPVGLVRLLPGHSAGDWRDSDLGLGGGLYPASVDACLMPAAIEALRELLDCGLVPGGAGGIGILPGELQTLRAGWADIFGRFVFDVESVWGRDAQGGGAGRFVKAVGLAPSWAMPGPTDLRQPSGVLALSLDATGQRVKVMHSDGLMLLLAPRRPPVDLGVALAPLLAPFPSGLNTPCGPLVASPVTDPGRAADFGRSRYHGMVVWSWPMVLARLGVARLREWGESALARQLESSVAAWGPARVEPDELWSITVENGRIVRVPFGSRAQDATESNTLQLWSLASVAAVLSDAEEAPGR